jgi:hypothetical protein
VLAATFGFASAVPTYPLFAISNKPIALIGQTRTWPLSPTRSLLLMACQKTCHCCTACPRPTRRFALCATATRAEYRCQGQDGRS